MAIKHTTTTTVRDTGHVVRDSSRSLIRNPQILVYPILASLFVSATGTLIGATFFAHWYDRLVASTSVIVPNKLAYLLGIIGFSFFYTALIGAYFTCAVSADVLAKLDGRKTEPLYGLRQVIKHFFRVSRFALLSLFLFPVGIWTQRRKSPKAIVRILGSSFTLQMAQLAPAILSTSKPFGATVRDALETLGQKWKVSLILKICTYSLISLFIVLPKLIQHGFFSNTPNASSIAWLVSLEVAASGLVFFKVLNSIFITVLYHGVKHKK